MVLACGSYPDHPQSVEPSCARRSDDHVGLGKHDTVLLQALKRRRYRRLEVVELGRKPCARPMLVIVAEQLKEDGPFDLAVVRRHTRLWSHC